MSDSAGLMTLHDGTTFSISGENGDFLAGEGRGLYHDDTRFIRAFQLSLDDQTPILLTARTLRSNESRHFLTNPELMQARRGTLSIVRRRLVGDGMHEDIDIENYGDSTATLVLTLKLETDFADIFAVKRAVEMGIIPPKPEDVAFITLAGENAVMLRLERGIHSCETVLTFSESPELLPGLVRFRVEIPRRGHWHLCTVVHLKMSRKSVQCPYDCANPFDEGRERARRKRGGELGTLAPELDTDHPLLARIYRRAAQDLVALRIKGEETCQDYSIAAGIPWFMALFGRDSLIASYQAMFHDPSLARGTLRSLAHLQGKRVDKVSGEEPGKILHEYRPGMDASAQTIIPSFPYYGTIDATPLFLVTLSEYVRCTGDIRFANELWQNVEAALEWIDRYGDLDGDGLIEYLREGHSGLFNQGWKDSGDSIRDRRGEIAQPPIALIEVQGYVFDAYRRIAEICDVLGKAEMAESLRRKAEQLKDRILSRFWMEERQSFALALDGEKRPVDSLTSNPGHLLWSGVLPIEYARNVANTLLSREMFSGYGIRTMGQSEIAYNPISYHNGSVWPHDNSLILAGLAKYGLFDQARQLACGLLDALEQYPSDRLPELFAGYPADQYETPVEYPTANRPQAWATGAVFLLTRVLLGLEVNAPARQVSLRPIAIPRMSYLSLKGIPLGADRVNVVVRIKDGKATGELESVLGHWRQVA